MLFPIWQPRAASSHHLAQLCGELLGEKATHTGTLDPMAEGVLLVLTGADRFVKGQLSDWEKTYSFTILWGVATDSGDALGLIRDQHLVPVEISKVQSVIQQFPTEYAQAIPGFSARRFAGKSSFEYSRAGIDITKKHRTVRLKDLRILRTYTTSLAEIIETQNAAVAAVQGDFRQQEISVHWQSELNKSAASNLNVSVSECSVTTSPGTYIRQLVQDIANQVAIPATTWSITRTANGPFTKEDCIEVTDLAQLQLVRT